MTDEKEAKVSVKRKRKRMRTPPRDDKHTVVTDLYDNVVSHTFDDLGQLSSLSNVALHSCTDDTHPEGKDNQNDVEIINDVLAVEPQAEVVNDTVPVIVEEAQQNEPPPPPEFVPRRSHRLTNGIRAALNKLENSSKDFDLVGTTSRCDDDSVEVLSDSRDEKIKILVKVGLEYSRYCLTMTDKVTKLQVLVAGDNSCDPDEVMLFLNDNLIDDDVTVQGLGLTIADTVEACIVQKKTTDVVSNKSSEPKFTIKVQGKHGHRDVVNIEIGLTQPLDFLMHKFAEVKGLDVKKLQFRFDGEKVSPGDTFTSLDMDDGDCIDVTGY